MILVDTSVWIDHLRRGNPALGELLLQDSVVTHPLVVGELSLGNISRRKEFLELVRSLRFVREATHEEVSAFIERNRLWSRGVGYSDVHLLSSALLDSIPLWTLDKRLAEIARGLGVTYTPHRSD